VEFANASDALPDDRSHGGVARGLALPLAVQADIVPLTTASLEWTGEYESVPVLRQAFDYANLRPAERERTRAVELLVQAEKEVPNPIGKEKIHRHIARPAKDIHAAEITDAKIRSLKSRRPREKMMQGTPPGLRPCRRAVPGAFGSIPEGPRCGIPIDSKVRRPSAGEWEFMSGGGSPDPLRGRTHGSRIPERGREDFGSGIAPARKRPGFAVPPLALFRPAYTLLPRTWWCRMT
jgi:hypothetical protein